MASSDSLYSRTYFGLFVAVTLAAVGLAVVVGNRDMAFAAAILGLYVLHLYSVRTLTRGQREQRKAVRELEGLVGELARAERSPLAEPSPDDGASAPEPADDAGRRHFALGTVAIIRNALRPGEVSRILVEQRDRPEARFGELAVEMSLLSEDELEELLRVQREGRFSRPEIRLARRRLEAYHEDERRAGGEGPSA